MKIRKDVEKGKQEERAREIKELARSRRELERAEHELSSANARVTALTDELSKYEPATMTADAQKHETERLAEDLNELGFVLFSARYPARDVSVQIVPARFEAHGFGVTVTASSPDALLGKAKAKAATSTRRAPENGPKVLRGTGASGPEGIAR